MDTPSSTQGREELEKRLQQMKKKYAHMQKKLQKSVKQKKVKVHVQKRIAEQALLAGGDSPINTYAAEKDIPGQNQSSDSLYVGPLQLDDSITEHPDVHLTRKRVSSSARSKKRRSVSFVLAEGDVKPNDDTLPKTQNSDDEVKARHNGNVKESKHVSTTDEEPTACTTKATSVNDKAIIGNCPVEESHASLTYSSDGVMCVEETQDLSQLPTSRLLYNQETISRKQKQYGGYSEHESDKHKSKGSFNEPVKTNEVTLPIISSTTLSNTCSNLSTCNSIDTEPSVSDATPSKSSARPDCHNLVTFSDPGPRTTRNKRRRSRRNREFTAADISMKEVVQNSQSSQQGNHTWIEGLIYPVEYYVRKTRSMSNKSSPSASSENLSPKGFGHPGREVMKIGVKKGRRSMQDLVALSQVVQSSSQSNNSYVADTSNINDESRDTLGIIEVNNYELLCHQTKSIAASALEEDDDLQHHKTDTSLNSQSENMSSRESSQASIIIEQSLQNNQVESHNKSGTSSQSSINSNSSSNDSSRRRTLSLSRRRRRMPNGSLQKDTAKINVSERNVKQQMSEKPVLQECQVLNSVLNQHKILKESNVTDDPGKMLSAECECNSYQPSTTNRTILPELSQEIISQLLSQKTDFILPDSEFVELKLIKAKTSMTCQSPLAAVSQYNIQAIAGVTEPPLVQRNIKIKGLTLSEDFSHQKVSGLNKSEMRNSGSRLEIVSRKGESAVPATGIKDCIKSDINTHSLDPPSSTTNKNNLKSFKVKAVDYQQVSPNKSLMPSAQEVLESQFSQCQPVPSNTAIFPDIGCTPGISPAPEVTIVNRQEEVIPTLLTSSPTRTMSFSPHESCSAIESGDVIAVDRNQLPSGQNVNTSEISPSKSCASERSAPPNIDIDAAHDEFFPPGNGVVTPPLITSSNVAHTSPFADVATATPYGKAKMPNCQSQCDPQEEEEEEEGLGSDEEEMTSELVAGMKYAGCLTSDLPSAIIGMCSCSVFVDGEELMCLVVYSVDVMAVWVMRDDTQWHIEASWAVSQKEEIVCVQVLSCCETNVLSLAIGGQFQQCCARLLRYNLVTREHQQLDLCIAEQLKDIQLQDVCIVSPCSILVQTNVGTHYHIYKFDIAQDFRKATSHVLHTSEFGPMSLQRVSDIEDMVVMTSGKEILLWDIRSDCILQRFNLSLGIGNLCTTCLYVCVQSDVLFVVLGIKTTDYKLSSTNRVPLCILMALNPATGRSAILHRYEIPGTSQDSYSWFCDGVAVKSKIAAQNSDGELFIWDMLTAKPMAKIACPADNREAFHWTLTQEGGLLLSLGKCIHIHS